MVDARLPTLLADLREHRAESGALEAKAARDAVPKDALETLCSFANTPGGGTLLLGIVENQSFDVVGVADAAKTQADVVSWCADRFTPPLRPTVSIETDAGRSVVIVDVEELPRSEKPCYVSAQGMVRGCYLRVGESDRRLTAEEVQQLVAERGQPTFDTEVVPGAAVTDLDEDVVAAYLRRVRARSARAFTGVDDHTVLTMTGVLAVEADGTPRPTIAGLLALGRYPQQFLPQVNTTFVSYPTPAGADDSGGVRFLDNVAADGSIPEMVLAVLTAVQRNSARRAVVQGAGRVDVPDFPETALREVIVNALVHRDLSSGSRGTQVQVEMYPDRLVIKNPGGLFGAVDIAHLGDDGRSSARNARLLRILEDVPLPHGGVVCENRGSGVRTMVAALRRAGMGLPSFTDGVTTFSVKFPNHTLLDDDTIRWLGRLTTDRLRDTQRLALAAMRRGDRLDNSTYRRLTGVTDSRTATYELQDLVARELVEQHGTRRGSSYALSQLARTSGPGGRRPHPDRGRQIVELLQLRRELSKAEVVEELGLGTKTVEHWLRLLKRDGLIETSSPPRSRNTRYRLTSTVTNSSSSI
ncbi:ATP-binding protein [Kineococcus sp. TBRC 1896]|uniref:ATP-binding protein n=1 Tax=Kineococcus mangrovi TaxID=1660183 RepID=A0ABV4I5P1_9ACTN